MLFYSKQRIRYKTSYVNGFSVSVVLSVVYWRRSQEIDIILS